MKTGKGHLPNVLLIIIAGVFLTVPAIIYGFPFYSPDGHYHVLWYSQFSDQLWQGDLYPRWLSGVNGGLGSPVFFYYPPVAYYLSSFWRLLIPNDEFGWWQLGASAAAALILSGLSAYLWLREISGQKAALLAAILYMAMPYHLAIDLYFRGAFAEFWAFVWLPLILYFVKKVCDESSFAASGLAISYALLIMTHLPTALIFSVVPIGYALFLTNSLGRKMNVAFVIGAMLSGVGLAAVYLVPALTLQENVSFHEMYEGGKFNLHYENAFFSFKSVLELGIKSRLFVCTALTIALAGCFFFLSFSRKILGKKENLFWMTIILLSFFMMTPVSKFVWQLVPTLQKIQFPWRFNSLIVVAAAALVALGLSALKKPFKLPQIVLLSAIAILTLSWLPITAYCAWRSSPVYSSQEETLKVTRYLLVGKDTREYRPRWATDLADQSLNDFLQALTMENGELQKVKMIAGAGAINVLVWKPRQIALQAESETGMTLRVSQFYYPGWTARISGESNDLNVQPNSNDGLLNIAVPSGNHQILVALNKTKQEFVGQIISAVSLCVVLLIPFGIAWIRKRIPLSLTVV